jgi:hypothetical protein
VTIHTKLTLAVAAAGLLAIATAALTWQLRSTLRRLEKAHIDLTNYLLGDPDDRRDGGKLGDLTHDIRQLRHHTEARGACFAPSPVLDLGDGHTTQQLHCDLPDGHRGAHQADQGDGLPPAHWSRDAEPAGPRQPITAEDLEAAASGGAPLAGTEWPTGAPANGVAQQPQPDDAPPPTARMPVVAALIPTTGPATGPADIPPTDGNGDPPQQPSARAYSLTGPRPRPPGAHRRED